MNEGPSPAAPAAPAVFVPTTAPDKINLPYHAIIGVAMGAVGLFTAFAWIPAILTGSVIGRANVEQSKGIRASGATQVVRILAVTGGVLAMLLLGAILGGLVAFIVAALAAFSERLVANAAPNDQTMARIVTILAAAATWFIALFVLNVSVNIRLGS
jgi:hypothetical protein